RFGDARVLVLDQRELLMQRRRTLWRVFEFLEVDPTFSSPAWDAEHNTASEHRLPTRLARRLGRAGRAGQRVPGVRRALAREIPRPRPTAEQRRRLVALFKPEAGRLRAMTGLS